MLYDHDVVKMKLYQPHENLIMTYRPSLNFEENMRVAYGHFCLDIDQQSLAALFVTNIGRVNEACTAVRMALENPKVMRKRMERELPDEESNDAIRSD